MKIRCIKIFIIIIGLLTIISNTVAAYDITGQFSGEGSAFDSTPVKNILSTILNVTRTVGIGVALIMLTYIGAKIMLASPSERANIKQYAMNYVIGAVILIGASGILGVIQKFTSTAIKAS